MILVISAMLFSLLATTLVSCGDEETPPAETPGGTVTVPGITPDYPAPPIEDGAEDVEDDEDKLQAPTGGGAVGMIYSNDVQIDLSDKSLTLLFANPNRSTHNVTVQLVVQDLVLAESGLLTPGKRITTLALKDGVQVPTGVYAQNAKFVVRFYDPQTNACSIVNSEIAVTVTVRECS